MGCNPSSGYAWVARDPSWTPKCFMSNCHGMHPLLRLRVGYQLGQRQHERRQRSQVGAHGGRRGGKDVLRAQAQAGHARGVLAPLDGPERGAVRQQHARRMQQLVLGARAVPPPARY